MASFALIESSKLYLSILQSLAQLRPQKRKTVHLGFTTKPIPDARQPPSDAGAACILGEALKGSPLLWLLE